MKNFSVFFTCLLIIAMCAVAQQPKLMLPIGHTLPLYSAKFSPDETKVVTASQDHTVKVWDALTGKLLIDLIGHNSEVYDARFSPDGKKIISVSYDTTAKVWNAFTGKLIITIKGHTRGIIAGEISPNGKLLLTVSYDSIVKVWNIITGKSVAALSNKHAKEAHFSPDGNRIILIPGNDFTSIWEVRTGNLLVKLKEVDYFAKSGQFSPDGKKIITVSDKKMAEIWNTKNGRVITTLKGHTKDIYLAQFSPNGKLILTVSNDESAKIWDAATGQEIAGLSGSFSDARFSPDGRKIVTLYRLENKACIWNAADGKLLSELNGVGGGNDWTCFSADSKKLVIGGNGNIAKIWDVDASKWLAELKGYTKAFSNAELSPDGKKIVTGSDDRTAKIWDAVTGKLLINLKGHTGSIRMAKFSHDGLKVVTASWDKTAKIWDAITGQLLIEIRPNKAGISQVVFSPDDKKILISSLGQAFLWDANTGIQICQLKMRLGEGGEFQFSRDGTKICCGSMFFNTVSIWDGNTGKFLYNFAGSEDNSCIARFSPDGKKIVIASSDSTCKIWDVNTRQLLLNLEGHNDALYAARFSLDGTKVFTLTMNYTRVWDANTGKLLEMLPGNSNAYYWAHFSADGRKGVTSDGHTATVWDGITKQPDYSFFAVDSTDYLIVDTANHYDGTAAARKLLYFTCGTEVIELDQLKDQLWVPNLAERISKGETINAKTLNELNICGLTPEVKEKLVKPDEYFFTIHPRRGGLGETILFVNGIEAKKYTTAQLKKVAGDYQLTVGKDELKDFIISGKENTVLLKAYTADNAISSRGAVVNIDNTKEAVTVPNLYAVMIGVSDYKGDELDLKYAAKDATDISAAIANAARKLLNTDSAEHVFMYNLTTAKEHYRLPEKNSIKKILEDIGKKATANDVLLIFFAGHGIMEGTDKKQFYFLTADASKAAATAGIADVGISTAELTEWMKPQNIRAQKRILIFDACNSGQAIKDFVSIGAKDQEYLSARNDDKAQQIKNIEKLNEKSGLFILSAAASNQSAYEMGRYAQGLLTYALLKAIKQQPDILEDGKYLNISRWFNAAEKTVTDLSKENGARQEPQVVSNTNFNIGIVDAEVMAKIVLPGEKPLFAASNFQNNDETADGDNLELSKLINFELNDLGTRGNENKIVYVTATNSPDAYSLSGRYDIKGDAITIKVAVKRNNKTIYRFDEKGIKEKLAALVTAMVTKAAEWVVANN